MTLRDLLPGQKGKIMKIHSDSDFSHRIIEMGMTPGTVVEVEKIAPLGDPMDIKVRGYHLSLRKNEVKHIQIEMI